MSYTFNRSEILKAAHFMASWRKCSGAKATYAQLFAEALRHEWKKAKAARARFEQNTGLPIRTCPADVPAVRRTYFTRLSSVSPLQFAA